MLLEEPDEILEPTAQKAMDKKRGRLPSQRRSSPSVNNQQVVNNRRPKRVSKRKQWEDINNIIECKPCASRAKRKYAAPSSPSPTPSKLSNWDDLSETGKWMEELRPFTRSRTGNCKCEVKSKKKNTAPKKRNRYCAKNSHS